MKKCVLIFGSLLLLCFTGNLFAQNKTLGVGASSPNPNAVLHAESPTNNQGFLMPRMTTAQRTASAFQEILNLTDIGLMVYDTDLMEVYTWEGSAWGSGSEIPLPYADTLFSAPDNSNLLRLVYAGSGVENVGVAHFENLNANSGFSAIFGRTNSATNGVADFIVNNPANNNDAISVTTNGVGTAGRFRTNNTRSTTPTLWVESNSDSAASAPVYGLNTGTGDAAAVFRINNAASTMSALFAESNGSGPSVFAYQLGLGRAGQFQISNTSNSNAAVRAFTSGTGYSGFYTINNASSSSPGLYSTTNGTGAAVFGQNTGTGNGFAGLFSVTQASNTFPAIQASSAGTGSGVRVMQSAGTGAGIDVYMQNASSSATGITIDQQGLGSSSTFIINNISNTNAAILGSTAGTGAAIQGQTSTGFTAIYGRREGATNGNAGLFEIVDAGNTYPALQVNTVGAGGFAINAKHTGSSGDAIYGEHQGAGGSAGNFRISNGSNTASTLFAATNSGAGTAIGASNESNGVAFAIWAGGVKVTTHTVTTTSITTRAAAYQITSGGTVFTLDFGPTPGEVYLVYNETGAAITVAGVAIPNGEGRTIVNFGGAFRGF